MKLDQFHDGEWVEPCRRGFRLMCCRCGLTHVLDFKLVRRGGKNRIQLRARRVRLRKRD